MENISGLNQVEKVKYSYIFIIGLMILAAFAVAILGIKGLILSILGLTGLILAPLLYNKPKLFLFFSLLVYPFTRFLPLNDKFIITGVLYTLSLPCVFWIIKKYFRKVSTHSFYLWAMVTYIAVILLNFIRPGTSMVELAKEFGTTFFGIFIILAIYNYVERSWENLHKLTKYLSYLFNIIALIAIGQYVTGIGGMVNEGFYRVRGTFYNFNDYAYVLSLFICFALYVLLSSNKHRFYWIMTIGINLVALSATISKTSMINVALIFLVMSMFLPWKRKIQLFASSVVIGSLLAYFLILSGTLNSLVLRFMDTSSFEWRLDMWRRLYNMILQGNTFLGQGINASKGFIALLVPAGESAAPHNVYLETTYDLGLIGLIPFILIFAFILIQGIAIFTDKETINNQNKIIGTSIIIIALITIIQNFVSNAFYDRAGNIIFWAILTLLVCWHKYYKQSPSNR
jgi:O-antigen ligase